MLVFSEASPTSFASVKAAQRYAVQVSDTTMMSDELMLVNKNKYSIFNNQYSMFKG
jgi:hypothetical protein